MCNQCCGPQRAEAVLTLTINNNITVGYACPICIELVSPGGEPLLGGPHLTLGHAREALAPRTGSFTTRQARDVKSD